MTPYLRAWMVTAVLLCILIESECIETHPSLAQEPATAQETGVAQSTATNQEQIRNVIIADEPKYIDPIEWVPESLRKKVTHTFQEAPLNEVANWIQSQTGLSVVLDERALEEENLSSSELVTESLVDVPVFQFLDRLERMGVDWNLEGNMVTLLPPNASLRNVQYNIGDLLDVDYKPDDLLSALTSAIAPDSWGDAGGVSTVVLLGDVLFVRQVPKTHRRIAAFLEALRHPSRRTWVDESKEHETIASILGTKASVQFQATPLAQAIQSLATQHRLNIRLDRVALRKERISERLPISIDIREQPLQTILQFITSQHGLGWFYRDGVVWITPENEAKVELKLAVFDVRDLCSNRADCSRLLRAIEQQADPEGWSNAGGIGVIAFPLSGIMVISQKESIIDEVLNLLENYRSALKNSKRRISPESDPEGYETKYYRLPTPVAQDLQVLLPKLIAKNSWNDQDPSIEGALGTIQICRSRSDVRNGNTDKNTPSTLEPYSVLIIHQKRKIHPQISDIITKIEAGDAPGFGVMGGIVGGMGGGMGGTGGGTGGGMGGMF
ncbi:MAG: hypothetical protein FJ308_01640 [Planctomycetes bacterium]|nr:hypothetical protein [Planctomycetota bacterium]